MPCQPRAISSEWWNVHQAMCKSHPHGSLHVRVPPPLWPVLIALLWIAAGCKFSRCIYKCPRACVRALLSQARPDPPGARGSERGVSYAAFRSFFLLLPQTDMMVEYWLNAHCPGRCDVGGCVVLRDQPAKVSGPWRTRVRRL